MLCAPQYLSWSRAFLRLRDRAGRAPDLARRGDVTPGTSCGPLVVAEYPGWAPATLKIAPDWSHGHHPIAPLTGVLLLTRCLYLWCQTSKNFQQRRRHRLSLRISPHGDILIAYHLLNAVMKPVYNLPKCGEEDAPSDLICCYATLS